MFLGLIVCILVLLVFSLFYLLRPDSEFNNRSETSNRSSSNGDDFAPHTLSSTPPSREKQLDTPLDAPQKISEKDLRKNRVFEQALTGFENSLKQSEKKRAETIPMEVFDDGNQVKMWIPEPSLGEIEEASMRLQNTLKQFSREEQRSLRPVFQRIYDDYFDYKRPFRYVAGIKPPESEAYSIHAAWVTDTKTKTQTDGGFYHIDPRYPNSTKRFSELINETTWRSFKKAEGNN